MAHLSCNDCNTIAEPLDWRCRACGGSLDIVDMPAFSVDAIDQNDFSLWRYAAMLPVTKRFTLGEGMTPLVPITVNGDTVHAKLDYLNPTGSYKDRGTTTLINHIAGYDVDEVIDNSSGNAGASIAAFASVAGIKSRIFVPADTAVESKKQLIRAFGGAIVESGDSTADVYAAAEHSTYASHAWSAYFVLGQMTVAWETWEQLGRRVPDAIATPVGHGGLFLGFYRGFKALYDAGVTDKMPKMIAVQSAGVDPVVRAWEQNLEAPLPMIPEHSIADGILVTVPVRGKQLLSAIYDTGGYALRVDNEAIATAQQQMMARGIVIEATSAVTAAALPQIRKNIGDHAELVVAFTGNGLKNIGAN
jgi:threonine synthase